MAEKTINTRLVLRNAELSVWEQSVVKLLSGEMALARLSGQLSNNFRVRIGVGGKTWNELSDQGQLLIPVSNVEGLTEAIQALSTSYYETDDIAKLSATYVNGDIAVEKKYIAGTSYKYTVNDADLATSSVTVEVLSGQNSTVNVQPISVWLSSDAEHTEMKREDADENRNIEYCAYRYSTKTSSWQALDGNYSAENVYFKEDITCAGSYKEVGNVTKELTGTTTITASGKSVKDVFQSIFTKELDASIATYPKWTLTTNSTTLTSEVGATYYPAGATVTLTSQGSYTYGPDDTGIFIPANNAHLKVRYNKADLSSELSNSSALSAVAGSNALALANSSTAKTYLSGGESYSYEAYAYHPAGVSAWTNLKNPQNVKIAADNWDGNDSGKRSTHLTASLTYVGYYPCYYGQFSSIKFSNPGALTSADIVSYSGGAVTAKNDFDKKTNSNQRPADVTSFQTYTGQQWFWIAKKGKITSVDPRQSEPAAAFGTVKGPYTVVLPTANGYGDTEYDVWYVSNDNPAKNGYKWKLNGTF